MSATKTMRVPLVGYPLDGDLERHELPGVFEPVTAKKGELVFEREELKHGIVRARWWRVADGKEVLLMENLSYQGAWP